MLDFAIISLFVFFLYRLIIGIGKSFPLFELTAVLYLLQYCIAPMLEYNYDLTGEMAVSKDVYLPFALYGSMAYIIGLFFFKPKLKLENIKIDPEMASKLGRIFLAVGIGSSIAMLFLPQSLKSIINFFIILKGPGVFSLIFSNKRLDMILVVTIFLEIAISAIINALLIEFIVFSAFFIMFLSLRYKISIKVKLSIALIGILFLTIYQGVKADYRDYVWGNDIAFEDRVVLLSDLITMSSIKEAFNADITNNESIISTIYRLNQGWQTSKVLYQVPEVVPYENGSALLDDVLSSIMPRAFYPNKRVVNDYKRFNYYTGYDLNESTSMSIGVLGDFYINFGFYISLFFLLIFGAFFSKIAHWFYKKYVAVNPLNLIWLPFLFSYLIRPGNEFYMVLNHLVKGLIVFLIVSKVVNMYIPRNSEMVLKE